MFTIDSAPRHSLKTPQLGRMYANFSIESHRNIVTPSSRMLVCLRSLLTLSLELEEHLGCGTGKYVKLKSDLFALGCDRSEQVCELAREKYAHIPIVIADNLHLPYRNDLFDAVLSIGVIHHLATHQRRVQAIQGEWQTLLSLCSAKDMLRRMSSDPETQWWSIINLYLGSGTETSKSKMIHCLVWMNDPDFSFSSLVKIFSCHVLRLSHDQVNFGKKEMSFWNDICSVRYCSPWILVFIDVSCRRAASTTHRKRQLSATDILDDSINTKSFPTIGQTIININSVHTKTLSCRSIQFSYSSISYELLRSSISVDQSVQQTILSCLQAWWTGNAHWRSIENHRWIANRPLLLWSWQLVRHCTERGGHEFTVILFFDEETRVSFRPNASGI